MMIRPEPEQEPDGWRLGGPLAIICHFKDHKPGEWHSTFQPHVQQQDCLRCGAARYRTIPWERP